MVQQTIQEQMQKQHREESANAEKRQARRAADQATGTGGLSASELVNTNTEGAKEAFEKMAQEVKDSEKKNREQAERIRELQQQIKAL